MLITSAKMSDTKFILTQIFLNPKYICNQNLYGRKKNLGPTFFWDNIFGTKNSFGPKFLLFEVGSVQVSYKHVRGGGGSEGNAYFAYVVRGG